MFSKYSVASTFVLVFAVGATSIIAMRSNNFLFKLLEHHSHSPQSIASGITLKQFGPQGALKYHGTAKTGKEYADGSMHLIHTRMTFYQKKGPPWHTSSDKAIITDNQSKVDLIGHVVLTRPATKTQHAMKIITTHLMLYPHRHYAYTDAPVTFSQPGTHNITHAIGMEAYSQPQERLYLLSDVRSTFDAQKS
jgi:LPS export ABC transporter protein LptC